MAIIIVIIRIIIISVTLIPITGIITDIILIAMSGGIGILNTWREALRSESLARDCQ